MTAVVVAIGLAGCGGGATPGPPASSASTAPAPAAVPSTDLPSTDSPSTDVPPSGPTADDLAQARRDVAALDVDEAVGQVMVARYSGTDPAIAADLVTRLHLAGVIVFSDNVSGADQVRATAAAVQAASAADDRDWPAIVSVDQEGGRVARLDGPATAFPTLMTHGAARDDAVTSEAAAAAGAELRGLGMTTVFAPDADVTSGPQDPTIGSRSASDDPAVVSQVVTAALAGYSRSGIVSAVKHFPGHGSVPADSHVELPVQSASQAELAARDLPPFVAAVEAGAPMVMMSHIAVQAWDPGVPASLSPAAYSRLREDTGFTGVAVTDALEMAAVVESADGTDPAVRALAAGADLLLMPTDPAVSHAAVVAAVQDGTIARQRLDEAATRVVALQRWQGRQPASSQQAEESAVTASYASSLAGMTVLDDACSGPLVGAAVQLRGGTDVDRARFTDSAERAGLELGSGDVVELLGENATGGDGAVVVALDQPYALGDSTASVARIALYGRSPSAFDALVDVLTGQARSGGTLPVAVRGIEPRAGCG